MTKFYEDTSRFGYNRAELVIASGQTSSPLIVDIIYSAMTIAVIPQGSAKAQYTICTKEDIDIDKAVWLDWNIEETTVAAADTVYGVVTAIRLVSLSGNATIKVVAR